MVWCWLHLFLFRHLVEADYVFRFQGGHAISICLKVIQHSKPAQTSLIWSYHL